MVCYHVVHASLWQTNEEASRVVSKNKDFVYFCSPISGMAIAPNSLSSGLNRALKHAAFLQHQSGWGFQLVFLISNDLDGDATDWNALRASVNCDPAQNVESAESRGSDDLIPKEIAAKVSRWAEQHARKIFCRESFELISRIVLRLFDQGTTNNAQVT